MEFSAKSNHLRNLGPTLLVLFGMFAWAVPSVADERDAAEKTWWKGNLHTHSLWSDGNDFPDMIAKRFVDRDYHFLAITDHNVLSQSKNKWMDLATVKQRGGDNAFANYLKVFGEDWVELKKNKSSGNDQVRLKTLTEIKQRFESPGKFLMIEAEEISDRAEGKPIHMNATNLKNVISPVGGETVIETINNNLRAVQEQAKKNGEPILLHLNHPNFGWAVTSEELAAVTEERFFEVYNGHPSINHLGDEKRPSVELMWDIANTIRIDQLKSKPLFGLATDDSHHYHNRAGKKSRMGRGWVMVKSNELSASSLIDAMNQGDFYSSSGVELETVQFSANRLSIRIKTQTNVEYTTKFIGTLKNYDRETTVQLKPNGKPMKATKLYSKDVGKVLATIKGPKPFYDLTGNELYVRAVISSDQPHLNASFENQLEQAWTQPVGWRK